MASYGEKLPEDTRRSVSRISKKELIKKKLKLDIKNIFEQCLSRDDHLLDPRIRSIMRPVKKMRYPGVNIIEGQTVN